MGIPWFKDGVPVIRNGVPVLCDTCPCPPPPPPGCDGSTINQVVFVVTLSDIVDFWTFPTAGEFAGKGYRVRWTGCSAFSGTYTVNRDGSGAWVFPIFTAPCIKREDYFGLNAFGDPCPEEPPFEVVAPVTIDWEVAFTDNDPLNHTINFWEYPSGYGVNFGHDRGAGPFCDSTALTAVHSGAENGIYNCIAPVEDTGTATSYV